MLKIDMDMYALTRDRPGGPIIQYVDDGIEPMSPPIDENGNITLAGAISYSITLIAIAGMIAYLMLAI
ncbi:hypothetical protein [Sphingobium estronivorans]|uniref:hypothetical protein n=1 Tax=Sphingobium estronivorans TaxID=1577690 RepID=UPI001239E62F|nr:hypothetical protein [Sphingobium estronivorans]